MKTTIIIDGGLGRLLTAVPALEKYVEKYPETIIVIYGWTSILWGNKKLSNNIYDSNTKGLLNLIKSTKIIKPEPYYNSAYLSGQINLIDAWNQEINCDNIKLDILPQIYLTNTEIQSMSYIRNNYYTKIIAFQPFGSTAFINDKDVNDSTLRSLNTKTTKYLIKLLKDEGYGLWLMYDKTVPFLDRNDFINAGSNNIRETIALLYHCDYFIGIDSSGQHIARSLNIPGSVIMGGTNAINVTYPDYFNILNNKLDKSYMPYRIAEFDYWLSELNNTNILNFTDKELHILGKNIVKHINRTVRPRQNNN